MCFVKIKGSTIIYKIMERKTKFSPLLYFWGVGSRLSEAKMGKNEIPDSRVTMNPNMEDEQELMV